MGMALGTKKPTSDINVTPLIDVVLVLLIIFMVLTPLAEKQKYTRVPEYQPEAQPVPGVKVVQVAGAVHCALLVHAIPAAAPPQCRLARDLLK